MSLLALGLVVGVLAWVLGRRGGGGRPAPALAALAYGVPALFLALVLWTSRDSATRLRFALLGLGFRGDPGTPIEVAVGGDREEHEVWISALAEEPRAGGAVADRAASLPLGELRFEPREETASLRWRPASRGPPGLLGVRSPGEDLRPLRAIELEDGDRLRIAGRWWEVRLGVGPGGAAVFRDGEGREIALPRRRGELPLIRLEIPIWRPLPAALETYPVAWLERAAGGDEPAAAAGEAFFFQRPQGILGSRLWLAPGAEVGLAIERAGEAVPIPGSVEIPTDASLHVLSPPRWDGAGFRAGGVRDRRSFRWRAGRRSLVLAYDTPEIYVLSRASLEDLLIAPSEDGEVLRVHLSMGGWQITDRSLHFRHASRKTALEALATLELPRELLRGTGRADFLAATPRGQQRAVAGEPVWLGGEHLAAVQIDLLSPSVLLGLLALVLAAFKVAAARAGGIGAPQLLFAAALEALVTLRLLAGFRAWVLPPFAEEAYELALVAWSLLPWTFLVAGIARSADRGDGERRLERAVRPALPALGGLVFSLAWCGAFAGGFRLRVFILCHTLALAAWLASATGFLDGAIVRGRRALETLGGRRGPWVPWLAAAFAPGLLRCALVFVGSRESLELGGQRLALTLAHVPLAIAIEAAYLVWLWRRTAEAGRLRPADLMPALWIVAGTWLLPALVASDLGLFLLNVPVFLAALASLALAAGRRLREDGLRPRRWIHRAPAAALGVYLLFAAFPVGARAILTLLPEEAAVELGSERNYLRLLAFAYPRELERLALRGSEELTVMSAVMDRYTSGPVAGRGYFGSELSPHLRATALREHAPAVFVAAEWGLLGVLGLLVLYLAAAASGFADPPWRTEERWLDPRGGPRRLRLAIACLAAATVALPSIYMVLANYRLTLFTGKNAYLLGLDSTADVLEGFVLVLLSALGMAAGGEEEI